MRQASKRIPDSTEKTVREIRLDKSMRSFVQNLKK